MVLIISRINILEFVVVLVVNGFNAHGCGKFRAIGGSVIIANIDFLIFV